MQPMRIYLHLIFRFFLLLKLFISFFLFFVFFCTDQNSCSQPHPAEEKARQDKGFLNISVFTLSRTLLKRLMPPRVWQEKAPIADPSLLFI